MCDCGWSGCCLWSFGMNFAQKYEKIAIMKKKPPKFYMNKYFLFRSLVDLKTTQNLEICFFLWFQIGSRWVRNFQDFPNPWTKVCFYPKQEFFQSHEHKCDYWLLHYSQNATAVLELRNFLKVPFQELKTKFSLEIFRNSSWKWWKIDFLIFFAGCLNRK